MNHTSQIQLAIAMAHSSDASERRWWKAHAEYLRTLPAHRAAYQGLRREAEALGMDRARFDAACRREIDEDIAADDAREWVRAARLIRDSLCISVVEPSEQELFRDAVWARACDHALNTWS